MFKKIRAFLLSVVSEYKKVIWPSRKGVIDVTVLVIYLVLFFLFI